MGRDRSLRSGGAESLQGEEDHRQCQNAEGFHRVLRGKGHIGPMRLSGYGFREEMPVIPKEQPRHKTGLQYFRVRLRRRR